MPYLRPAYCLTGTILVALSHHTSASGQFEAGEYFRDTELTPGWLTITSTSSSSLTFHLVTELRLAGDDGYFTRNGIIEPSEAVVSDASAIYISDLEEDKYLGTCQLKLQQHKNEITVSQSGKCWWFGEGVDASGTYRKHEFSPNERKAILQNIGTGS